MGAKVKTDKKLLSIGEASEYLGVSIDTLRRWEKKDKLASYRSPGGHRYFKTEDLDSLFGTKYERSAETKPRQKKEVEIVGEDAREKPEEGQSILLDRPPKEIKVPETQVVRIRTEAVLTNTSVLTPSTSSSTVPPWRRDLSTATGPGETSTSRVGKQTKYIALGILGVAFIAIIAYLIWKSTQSVLSPIP